jgi:DNA-binding response OmpR family regulator
MPRARVLVVEDDRAIREGLADALAFHGYAAVQAERGDTGLEKALHGGCDLVILDLVLPGSDGLAVLRELRRAQPTLPVIILTARGSEADRIRGLREGADD